MQARNNNHVASFPSDCTLSVSQAVPALGTNSTKSTYAHARTHISLSHSHLCTHTHTLTYAHIYTLHKLCLSLSYPHIRSVQRSIRIRTQRCRLTRPCQVPIIVSNHLDFEPLCRSYGINFLHLPVTSENKSQQEERVLTLISDYRIELVVLARYMQVLSPTLCNAMSGRIINIHHSFLPSFKGARPYHQAYERGVKITGATAHFVTSDLDEGPIIEQCVARVDHSMGPKELAEQGSNVESQVLATAVRWYADRRVFLNGAKTVIFT